MNRGNLPEFNDTIINHLQRGHGKVKKSRKAMIYSLVVIIFFLTIPEIVVRVLTPEQLASLSDYTSLGGILSPLLSLLIFLGLASIGLALVSISLTKRVYRALAGPKSR